MKIEILLLKEAIKQYEKGNVEVGDYAVRLVYLLREGKFRNDNHPPEVKPEVKARKPKEG